ncbi:hypothetical protein [Hymenobacter edaphi]|uniref:Uncharacterized protein n=1 Tax=Hymenobacter edaphi TaxID=2211146 RepID=A0A328BLS6_9BACT|nr:hypothetical protein [Hymenobacter edaphi]RAK68330.1 hypothetical protein DLM85_09900 [Hymenobacter edaphi]
MTDKQRAKLQMMQATLRVLDEYADLYTGNAAFGKARQQLRDLVAELDPTADNQQGAARTATPGAVKKQTKRHLAQRAAEVAAALYAHADDTDNLNLNLQTDSDYSESQLSRSTDNDLLRIAKNIHERATILLPQLQDQDVTAAELDELAAALKAFKDELATPRVAAATGKAHTQSLAADLRQANALLRNRADKFMVRFQRNHPQFHTAYQSARQTINTAARKENAPNPAAPTV